LGVVAVSAGLSSAFAALISTPLDVLKTRIQVQGTGLGDTARSLLAEAAATTRPASVFFSGGSARVLKYTPAAMAAVTYYEHLKRSCA
jgi:hypothetical protein